MECTIVVDLLCGNLLTMTTGWPKKCVVIEVVLFSVVALKTLDISQGSVATHLRRGGIFSDSFITRFLLILTVKQFGKLVNI